METKRKPEIHKRYTYHKFQFILGIGVWIIIFVTLIGFAIITLSQPISPLWLILFFFMIAGGVGFTVYVYELRRSYLMVTPYGIEFRIIGQCGTISWDNLKSISKRRISRSSTVYGFDLFKPITLESPFINVGNSTETFIEISTVIDIPQKGFIFSDVDYPQFLQTQFGQDLMMYAPQIYEGKLPERKVKV